MAKKRKGSVGQPDRPKWTVEVQSAGTPGEAWWLRREIHNAGVAHKGPYHTEQEARDALAEMGGPDTPAPGEVPCPAPPAEPPPETAPTAPPAMRSDADFEAVQRGLDDANLAALALRLARLIAERDAEVDRYNAAQAACRQHKRRVKEIGWDISLLTAQLQKAAAGRGSPGRVG